MLDSKPIKGFEGLYEISNAGNIRSFHSREAKKKISEANKGKHHTDEAREKMSRARRGKKNPQARQVRCITTDEIFNCIIEGATKYNANAGCISECCKGKRKSAGKHPTTGEKLVWQYTETI